MKTSAERACKLREVKAFVFLSEGHLSVSRQGIFPPLIGHLALEQRICGLYSFPGQNRLDDRRGLTALMRRISCAGAISGMGDFHRCSSLSGLPIRLVPDNGESLMEHSPIVPD